MTVHELKTWPLFFKGVVSGEKTWEVRINDRDYEVDDVLRLREWNASTARYTGSDVWARVTYVVGLPGMYTNVEHVGMTIKVVPPQCPDCGTELVDWDKLTTDGIRSFHVCPVCDYSVVVP